MSATHNARDIRLTRVYDAPVRAVWDAWTIPEQVAQWWGPRGFSLTTHSRELRPGGTWRYTMHGPDGVDYPNVTKYLVVEPLRTLVYDHGGTDDRPPLFRVSVTFAEEDGRTTMEMVSSLPSPEAAVQMAAFIRQAGGNATWDRLAEYLEETRTGRRRFVITRTFDAPIARVFDMWTVPEHLVKWLPPAGTTMQFVRGVIEAGRSASFVIASAQGTMRGRIGYLAIEPPSRVVYTQQFVDEDDRPAPAPFATVWPMTWLTTVLLSAEAADRTRVTVISEPYGEATAEEIEAFVRERRGMTRGWTGSFDALDVVLEGQ